jgi:hypothetical protein
MIRIECRTRSVLLSAAILSLAWVTAGSVPVAGAQEVESIVPIGSLEAPDTAPPLFPVVPPPPAQAPGSDAWGVEPNFGLAVSEVFLSNVVPWAFNEFLRNASFSQVNPDSWWHNIETGFQWDDNHFSTNQFAHPYQGSLYYNAARSNGYDYWQSAPFAFAGSFLWECCGETHLMSLNDFINTGMGGIALGEMLYRTSSMVLDNEASGSARTWKEVGGFFINPVRGATRLFTGRMGEAAPNPESPWDRRPPILFTRLTTGARGINDRTNWDDPQYGAFFEVTVTYGGPWALERSKPFDFFTLSADVNTGDKKALGRLQVTGNLYHRPFGGDERSRHRFFVFQNFDYWNNDAYEFGGQSVSAAILSRWDVGESGRWNLFSAVDVYGMPMAAVNSDFAFIAEIPGTRERFREYDFGLGAGARLSFAALRGQDRIFEMNYRATYIHTLNGSVANGSDASHLVHMALLRGMVPLGSSWGVGADVNLFLRESWYSLDLLKDKTQRAPQARIYASWTAGDRNGSR